MNATLSFLGQLIGGIALILCLGVLILYLGWMGCALLEWLARR